MKNRKTTFTLLCITSFVGILIFQLGCSKDRIETKPLNSYDSPNKYLDSKKQEEQQFTIDSGGTCPLIAKQGTELCMANTCLVSQSGDSVHFPYKIGLIEIYKPKDMIYAQMPTVASGDILETAGEMRVRAYRDGKELLLRSGCFYTIKMPNAAPQNYMKAYYGDDGDNYTNWTDNPSPGVNSVFADTAGGYSNSITKFGWINCGHNRASSNSYKLRFTSSTDSLSNVGIFIYIPTTKTVMQVNMLVSNNIPDGSSVKIIAIGVKRDGSLYKFYKTLTVSSSQSIDVKMVSTSDAELTSLLDGL